MLGHITRSCPSWPPKRSSKKQLRFMGLQFKMPRGAITTPRVMKRHRDARDRMTEAVRVYIGLDKLEWEPPNPEDVEVQGETVNA